MNARSARPVGPSGSPAADTPPRVLDHPAPVFPAEARLNDWEGTVLVRVAIDAQGHPASVSVERSSGHAVLDESAAQAVERWRFAPRIHDGKAVPCTYAFPVRFKLDDEE